MISAANIAIFDKTEMKNHYYSDKTDRNIKRINDKTERYVLLRVQQLPVF